MSRKKFQPQEEEENLERWLLTYSDLITLLLAIFVMMYAFSKIKEGNPNTIQASSASAPVDKPTESTFLTEAQKEAEEKKLRKLRMQLEKKIKKKRYNPFVSVSNAERGLVISLKDQMVFDSGSADLKPMARQLLDDMYASIKNVPNAIRVEGHTDNIPIKTVAFPSNWHLSTSRAISVIFYLINRHGANPERFQAQGYGDTIPLVKNSDDASRARNRRVDIVVLKRGSEFVQPGSGKK